MPQERIVAVGLLTQREVELLGHGFSRLWPIDETPCFSDLIRAIDEADREFRLAGNRHGDSAGQGALSKRRPAEKRSEPVPGGGRY